MSVHDIASLHGILLSGGLLVAFFWGGSWLIDRWQHWGQPRHLCSGNHMVWGSHDKCPFRTARNHPEPRH